MGSQHVSGIRRSSASAAAPRINVDHFPLTCTCCRSLCSFIIFSTAPGFCRKFFTSTCARRGAIRWSVIIGHQRGERTGRGMGYMGLTVPYLCACFECLGDLAYLHLVLLPATNARVVFISISERKAGRKSTGSHRLRLRRLARAQHHNKL
jgi:hypothetical protein